MTLYPSAWGEEAGKPTDPPAEKIETHLPSEAPKVRVVGVPAPDRTDGKSSTSLSPNNGSQMGIGISIPFGHSAEAKPKNADDDQEEEQVQIVRKRSTDPKKSNKSIAE